jgi:hypothetical protein
VPWTTTVPPHPVWSWAGPINAIAAPLPTPTLTGSDIMKPTLDATVERTLICLRLRGEGRPASMYTQVLAMTDEEQAVRRLG